ncbi:MAG: thiamine-phosphate kinase [Nitratireductor sp.]
MSASPAPLGEFGRIARHFRPLAAGFDGARDLRDDAALLRPPAGCELVVTTDAIVAGVHYVGDETAADVAAKLVGVNLSDLAAMGADPYCYTLTLALPRDHDDAWVAAFAEELGRAQERYGWRLAGGDSVSTPGPACLTLTGFGLTPQGAALGRGGARDGDDLWVSGAIGDGLLGLEAARAHAFGEAADRLIARYRRPTPRLALGRALRGVAHAALDVSDGLIADAGHLASESGLTAEIRTPDVPLSPEAAEILADDPARFTELLTGGDDYELLFAAAPEARAQVAAAAHAAETPVARIGRLQAGEAGLVRAMDADGASIAIARPGYRHG